MFQALSSLLAPAVMSRMTLVLNHVLSSEEVARQRLTPHAGRTLRLALQGWPALLPPPPPLAWRVTPAGLLEWSGAPEAQAHDAADLAVRVDAANPAALLARALVGERPAVQIDGDAQLANDVGWLLHNLRWDVAADLERLFGPVVAQQLHMAGRALARALRAALGGGAPPPVRSGPGRPGAPRPGGDGGGEPGGR